MKGKFLKIIPYLVTSLVVLIFSQNIAFSASVPAFPGAEGFGANALGGRGGKVIEVTNLNDSGSGSLRAAIDASGARTVVFRVAGTIELASALTIKNPYITIAGQTAPGGGITIKNTGKNIRGILIQTHDVVIRYVRVRPGAGGGQDGITLLSNVAHDVIIDHCSVSWAVDENIGTWYDPYNFTLQWCVISEGLRNSTHPEGAHSMGAIFGSDGAKNFTIKNNLFAHNNERSPRIKTGGFVEFVNNVIYNYGNAAGVFSDDYANVNVNYIGNYVKRGLNTNPDAYEVNLTDYDNSNTVKVYVRDNIGPHRTSANDEQKLVVKPNDWASVVSTPFAGTALNTSSAQEAYEQVLSNAGASNGVDESGRIYMRRDTVDLRVVNDVRNGTGRIIDDPSDVGGWPYLDPGTPYSDSDHDGMADVWEIANRLNPNDSSDGVKDADGDGYTNLEEFLNGALLNTGSSNNTDSSSGGTETPTNDGVSGTFQLSAANYSVNEGAGKVNVVIKRADGSSGAASVEVRTLGVTADYATDYTSFSWTVVGFADGQTEKTISIAITEDAAVEGNETFSVLLRNPTGGASLGSVTEATVTIVDNDSNTPAQDTVLPSIVIASPANNVIVTSVQTVSIVASASDNVGVTKVEFYVDGKLIGADTTNTFSVDMPLNSTNNGNHSITAIAYDAAGNHSSSAPVNLSVNIPTVSSQPGSFEFSAANYSVNEGSGKVDVVIKRVGGASGAATVQIRTNSQTTDFKTDYNSFSWTTLNFADGESQKVMSIVINDDSEVEEDEIFKVSLRNPSGDTTLGATNTTLVTIVDND